MFITFTCNAKWEEITRELLPGQSVCDRPDLTSRVFKMKMDELLKDIKNGILGELLAFVYTIEFQKRGLPHSHILLILNEGATTWQDVDRVISAELPHPNNDTTKVLLESVKKFDSWAMWA